MLTRAGFLLDANLDVPVEADEEQQQAFEGKAGETPVHDGRDLGLIELEQLGGFGLGQVALADNLGDLARQGRLDQTLLRFGQTEIGKDVAGTLFAHAIFTHDPYPFSSASALCNRFLISSISGCGVSLPRFDFFWKAWST